ncbi:tRNA 2-thiouridine synthesizing protein C [Kushneria avicenniae]|uniref:tRNA 2-thiouridine synthesizing protein C n=1 Tax=Kushneria avicenniae TaxID=402385 RepID=A0A1I1FKV9_9GAMM|nr:DsrE family protein [Kushneria avicenniae]SFB99921.1 tRNA 2-thiouridine synthesizing protein C [Kushneria avicenniae]
MSSKSILVIVRHPPHGSSWVREGLETALVGAALGQPPTLLFSGDGVLALLAGQQRGALGQKGSAAMLEGLSLYDIEPLWYDRYSLEARGLTLDQLMSGCQPADIAGMIARHDVVMSF